MSNLPIVPIVSTAFEPPDSVIELLDRVRRRAYELYEQGGKVDGHDLEHWLQAEAELLQEDQNGVAA